MSPRFKTGICKECGEAKDVYKKKEICVSCATRKGSTPEVKAKISKSTKEAMQRPEVKRAHLRIVQSEEWRRKASDSAKEQWDKDRDKMIEANRLYWSDPKNREYHAEVTRRPEVRKRISNALRQVLKDPAKREQWSQTAKKLWEDPIYIENKMKSSYDRPKGERWKPLYNKESLPCLKHFDEQVLMSGNGIYAEHPYEERCGKYFLDYINHDYKVIIEWDEKHHKNEKKRLKDEQRQEYIESKYPDYDFYRIDEEEGYFLFLDDVREVFDYKLPKWPGSF